MDAGDFFGAVVVFAIGVVILLTIVGRNADPLIAVLPEIVVVAFFIAIIIGIANVVAG